jgi:hypothetical protein
MPKHRAALYPIGLLPRGRRRRGVGRAHPAGNAPPPAPLGAVGRDSHQDTGTQELRPALSVNTQPNHVLPLAHFGAISDVYGGGMVRTDHHDAGERSGSTQQHKCICWWLVRNGI